MSVQEADVRVMVAAIDEAREAESRGDLNTAKTALRALRKVGATWFRQVVARQRTVRRPPNPYVVIYETCLEYGVDVQDFRNESRHPTTVMARMVAAWLLRKRAGMSLPDIAVAMGRPNHSTVATQIKRLERMLEVGDDRSVLLERIRKIENAIARNMR